MNQNNFDLLNDLNHHLIIHIVSYLNAVDICKLEQTNKNMKFLIKEHQNIIWNNIYYNSKIPKIFSNNNSYNYKFKNYTLSLCLDNVNLKDKYKIAINSYNHYLNQ